MATTSYRWGPVQELVFLDRYSPKAAREEIGVGDVVVVMTSDDRRYPAKEVGVVEAVEGDEVLVRLKVNGEVIRRPRNRCDKPLETRPEQMWDRLARAAAGVEAEARRPELEREFRWLLDGFRFVPGGRINAMLGTDQALTAYNCYVIPMRGRTPDVPADSRHAIIDTLGNMVEIMARGGGVGINLSVLRPRLAYVRGVNGRSSGSVSWGALFSFATGLVEQGGCFGPDVRIATDRGPVPARELVGLVGRGERVRAWTHRGLRPITAAFRNGVRRLFRVRTQGGLEVDVTLDHRMAVATGAAVTTVPLRELRPGDEVLTLPGPGGEGATAAARRAWERGGTALAVEERVVTPVPDRIVAVEELGPSEVFDFEVDDVHLLSGNGVYTSNSRRGALMLILDVWHPDIIEFINAKRDFTAITNANISVGITEEFEQALERDGEWELVFPDTSDPDYDRLWDGNLARWKAMGKPVKVYQRLRARDLFRQIVESAWASAEPGFVRLDYANKMSNSWYYAPLISTNPCVTGDTRIATARGLRRAADLWREGRPVAVVNDARLSSSPVSAGSPVFFTGVKPVFRLVTREGFEVRLTADHKVLTPRGWVEAGELRRGEPILILNGAGAFGERGSLKSGLVLGRRAGRRLIGREVVADPARPPMRKAHAAVAAAGETCVQVLVGRRHEEGLRRLRVPEAVWQGTREMQAGFLRGLFSEAGFVGAGRGSRGAVVLRASAPSFLREVQQLLLNLGVVSHVRPIRRRACGRAVAAVLPPRTPGRVRQGFELRVSGEWLARFLQEVGFSSARQRRALQRLVAAGGSRRGPAHWTATFEKLVPDGQEAVFDLVVPGTHAFAGNGLVLHNCGEQPLPPWGVCLLGHLNLARFVRDGEVAWQELGRAARLAVRFLDNVIDITPYFFEENERRQKSERRVGMGTMGLGEMLIHLGIRYGSPEAVQFVDRLYGFIAREAYLGSVELAKEKGPFPAFDAEKFLQSGFMKTMPEEIREAVRRHGIRNVTLMTQAPTGTTGTMAGTSTGIEPYYAWSYWRHGRLGRKEVFEPVVQEYFEAHPELGGDVKKLPPYFVTALELTPEEHVRMQAAIQRWVDAAISKTANLPAHYTVEQTMELYQLAIKLGCKGVTIYRDRSRSEQVLVAKDEASPGQPPEVEHAVAGMETGDREGEAAAPGGPGPAAASAAGRRSAGWTSPLEVEPRAVIGEVPEEVEGFTYRQRTIVGTARVVVNEHPRGQPFETIIVLGKGGMDITADAEAIGRLISLYLRTPSPISNMEKLALVVEQLRNIGGAQPFGFGPDRVLSMPDALAKALERYLRTRRPPEAEPPGDRAALGAAARAVPAAAPGQTAERPAAGDARVWGEPGQSPSSEAPTPAVQAGEGPGQPERSRPARATSEGRRAGRHGTESGAVDRPRGAHGPAGVRAPVEAPEGAGGPAGASRPVGGAEEALERGGPVAGARNGRASAPAAADICPSCGQAQYVRIEGCGYCQNCGYTRC